MPRRFQAPRPSDAAAPPFPGRWAVADLLRPFRRRRGGLAVRLYAMFLGAALVPLAASDWVSGSTVSQVAGTLAQAQRAQTTRQTSRQVLDRLLTGKTLLLALPPSTARAEPTVVPRFEQVFARVVHWPAAAGGAASSDADRELLHAWNAAAPVSSKPLGAPARPSSATLRTLAAEGAPARVLLGVGRNDAPQWLAEFRPDYLWQPVADANDDSDWTVLDANGRALMRLRGADHPRGGSATGLESRSRLFLAAELGTGDWLFVQDAPPPQVLWQGQPLSLWLGLLAGATLLTVALLGRWQIVRMLEPLARLTQGTRRLAAGVAGTRVVPGGDDETAALAAAFNDMAGKIDTQVGEMRALAAIDQAILRGAPFERLAEMALERLALCHPHAGIAVCWCETETPSAAPPPDRTSARWRSRSIGMSPAQQAACEQAAIDLQLATGGDLLATDAGAHPWRDSALGLPGGRLTLLPLRQRGRIEGLVAIRSASAPGTDDTDGMAEAACELRDRLAVALTTRAREQELVHQALHDSLTGLINRYGLSAQLDAVLAAPPADGITAVLFVDLDHFKDVNDSQGHGAGDALLRMAAVRLAASVPPGTAVARQGGDEFALVARVRDAAEARAIASAAIAALGAPFMLQGGAYALGASVGIAYAPRDGSRTEELLRCADVALYAAKAAGRGRHAEYSQALDASEHARVQLLGELRAAIEQRQFVIHYQPRVDARNDAVVSAEALVRWQHPQRGLVYPDAFIGLAESSGLIDGIGELVLDEACAQMTRWRSAGIWLERISVNVSPQQLASGTLIDRVREALQRYALPAAALELEVTESLMVGDAALAAAQLGELRTWGISIAMDDFGTGYSSLASLRQLPIDVMKIDRSFVKDLGNDDGALAVIRTIVTLADSLGMSLVAEGVETAAQAALLRSMHCGSLQGFLFSRPVAAERFAALPGVQRRAVSPVVPAPSVIGVTVMA